MSRLMKLAIEEMEEGKNTQSVDNLEIKMVGPLADVYSKALAVAYKKPEPGEKEALESQAQEVTLINELISNIVNPEDEDQQSSATVFVTTPDTLDEENVVEITKEAIGATSENGNNFYLVIDATQPSVNGSQFSGGVERIETALEAFVTKLGGNYLKFK